MTRRFVQEGDGGGRTVDECPFAMGGFRPGPRNPSGNPFRTRSHGGTHQRGLPPCVGLGVAFTTPESGRKRPAGAHQREKRDVLRRGEVEGETTVGNLRVPRNPSGNFFNLRVFIKE